MEVFSEIHSDLTREGPGLNASTREAFLKIKDIPAGAKLLDIGCGPGIQTMQLASLLENYNGEIVASDVNENYLNALRQKISANDIGNIQCETADMFNLHYDDASFNILWAEGAIFIIGFEKGLTEWKRLLQPNGVVVVSELSWLKPDPPQEALDFWGAAYPPMQNVQDNMDVAERCGYSVEAHFTLPEAGWYEDYYLPMEQKIESLREKYSDNSRVLSQLDDAMLEIEIYKKHSAYYGYEFYILRLAAS